MATKSQNELLIETLEHLVNKCDQQAVKLIPGRMLGIFHSLEDNEISSDDYRTLVNRIRKSSEKFSNDCKCIGV